MHYIQLCNFKMALQGFSLFVMSDQTWAKVVCTVLKCVHKLYSWLSIQGLISEIPYKKDRACKLDDAYMQTTFTA